MTSLKEDAMRKELYYTLYDAECAADVYAQNHHGLVVGMQVSLYPLRATLDDNTEFDHVDDRFERNVPSWSGTVDAVRVVDKDTHADIACFAYWDDEID